MVDHQYLSAHYLGELWDRVTVSLAGKVPEQDFWSYVKPARIFGQVWPDGRITHFLVLPDKCALRWWTEGKVIDNAITPFHYIEGMVPALHAIVFPPIPGDKALDTLQKIPHHTPSPYSFDEDEEEPPMTGSKRAGHWGGGQFVITTLPTLDEMVRLLLDELGYEAARSTFLSALDKAHTERLEACQREINDISSHPAAEYLITTEQAAELAGVSVSTVRDWVHRKRIQVQARKRHPAPGGGKLLLDKRDVEWYIKNRSKGGRPRTKKHTTTA